MKALFTGIVVMLCSPGLLLAQDHSENVPLSYVVQGEEVGDIWNAWLRENEDNEEFRAWRILVVGVEGRRAMDSEIKRFERTFPDMSFDWEYDPPFYKLKTGVFTHRLASKPLLYEIKQSFPGALEIRDNVSFEDYFEEREP